MQTYGLDDVAMVSHAGVDLDMRYDATSLGFDVLVAISMAYSSFGLLRSVRPIQSVCTSGRTDAGDVRAVRAQLGLPALADAA